MKPQASKTAGDGSVRRSQNAEIRTGAKTKRNLNRCGNRVHQLCPIWMFVLTTKQQTSHDHDLQRTTGTC